MSAANFAAGCYIDGHHGHYAIPEVIRFADNAGRGVDAFTADLLFSYDEHHHEPDYPMEQLIEESDRAIDWLNEQWAVAGHTWGWNDGDFGLYPDEDEEEPTYRVRRFYADENHPDHRRVIATGLTLAEARAHCQDPATSGRDAKGGVEWFDGYDAEEVTA